MCVAVPMKVVAIEGFQATVEVDGVRREANLRLVPGAAIGDYVLVHAGFAIERLDRQFAQETLQLIREILRREELSS